MSPMKWVLTSGLAWAGSARGVAGVRSTGAGGWANAILLRYPYFLGRVESGPYTTFGVGSTTPGISSTCEAAALAERSTAAGRRYTVRAGDAVDMLAGALLDGGGSIFLMYAPPTCSL